eukprot:1157366-Pelagomonas_calceolata.AAC.4
MTVEFGHSASPFKGGCGSQLCYCGAQIAIKHGKRMPLLVSDRAMACRHLSCLKARASVP